MGNEHRCGEPRGEDDNPEWYCVNCGCWGTCHPGACATSGTWEQGACICKDFETVEGRLRKLLETMSPLHRRIYDLEVELDIVPTVLV